MSRRLRALTEQQIAKARAEGKLSDLAGEGKPLPHRPGDALIDPGTAIGHRIMAQAGALPEEIILRKKRDAARSALQSATTADEKKRLMSEISALKRFAKNLAHAFCSKRAEPVDVMGVSKRTCVSG